MMQPTDNQVIDPPLVRSIDDLWRVTDLLATAGMFVCMILGLTIPAYILGAGLLASWASRFIWAVAQVIHASSTGNPPKTIQRITHRGSHLALTVAMFMGLLQGVNVIAYFLCGVMVLISFERVMFLIEQRRLHT
jgi:hypothetical protein